MILQLYILLIVISFTFILLGYALKQDAHIFKIAGFTILFMLSVMIIPNTTGDIQYKSGSMDTYQYGNNFTSYHWDYDAGTAPDGPQLDAYTFHITKVDNYTTYENFTIGFALALCSFFGFINVFFTMRRTD